MGKQSWISIWQIKIVPKITESKWADSDFLLVGYFQIVTPWESLYKVLCTKLASSAYNEQKER